MLSSSGRSSRFSRSFPTWLAISATLAVVGFLVARAAQEDVAGPPRVQLDVPQAADATANGITFRATAAAFGGSGTFVELTAVGDFASLHVAATDIDSRGLKLMQGQEVTLAASRPAVLRFSPAVPGEATSIVINSVQLRLPDGKLEQRQGPWALNLEAPDDLPSRLQTRHLSGDAARVSGVTVSVEGAVLSSIETLVTLRVVADQPVQPLAQPYLLVDGARLFGGLVAERENGTLLTYSFPPVDQDRREIELVTGPFVRAGAAATWSVTLDVRALLANGDAPERTTIAADAAAYRVVGALEGVRSVEYGVPYSSSRTPGNRALRVTVEGAFDGGPHLFSAAGPSGPLTVGGIGVGYSKDDTGVISSPRTEIDLPYTDPADVLGAITITYAGSREELIGGTWKLRLR